MFPIGRHRLLVGDTRVHGDAFTGMTEEKHYALLDETRLRLWEVLATQRRRQILT